MDRAPHRTASGSKNVPPLALDIPVDGYLRAGSLRDRSPDSDLRSPPLSSRDSPPQFTRHGESPSTPRKKSRFQVPFPFKGFLKGKGSKGKNRATPEHTSPCDESAFLSPAPAPALRSISHGHAPELTSRSFDRFSAIHQSHVPEAITRSYDRFPTTSYEHVPEVISKTYGSLPTVQPARFSRDSAQPSRPVTADTAYGHTGSCASDSVSGCSLLESSQVEATSDVRPKSAPGFTTASSIQNPVLKAVTASFPDDALSLGEARAVSSLGSNLLSQGSLAESVLADAAQCRFSVNSLDVMPQTLKSVADMEQMHLDYEQVGEQVDKSFSVATGANATGLDDHDVVLHVRHVQSPGFEADSLVNNRLAIKSNTNTEELALVLPLPSDVNCSKLALLSGRPAASLTRLESASNWPVSSSGKQQSDVLDVDQLSPPAHSSGHDLARSRSKSGNEIASGQGTGESLRGCSWHEERSVILQITVCDSCYPTQMPAGQPSPLLRRSGSLVNWASTSNRLLAHLASIEGSIKREPSPRSARDSAGDTDSEEHVYQGIVPGSDHPPLAELLASIVQRTARMNQVIEDSQDLQRSEEAELVSVSLGSRAAAGGDLNGCPSLGPADSPRVEPVVLQLNLVDPAVVPVAHNGTQTEGRAVMTDAETQTTASDLEDDNNPSTSTDVRVLRYAVQTMDLPTEEKELRSMVMKLLLKRNEAVRQQRLLEAGRSEQFRVHAQLKGEIAALDGMLASKEKQINRQAAEIRDIQAMYTRLESELRTARSELDNTPDRYRITAKQLQQEMNWTLRKADETEKQKKKLELLLQREVQQHREIADFVANEREACKYSITELKEQLCQLLRMREQHALQLSAEREKLVETETLLRKRDRELHLLRDGHASSTGDKVDELQKYKALCQQYSRGLSKSNERLKQVEVQLERASRRNESMQNYLSFLQDCLWQHLPALEHVPEIAQMARRLHEWCGHETEVRRQPLSARDVSPMLGALAPSQLPAS